MVVNRLQSRKPSSTAGAVTAICGRSGQRRRASRAVRPRFARPNRAGTTRGHQSLTPKSHQPRWNSQNSSGGLSL
jgi:hypothetical protein